MDRSIGFNGTNGTHCPESSNGQRAVTVGNAAIWNAVVPEQTVSDLEAELAALQRRSAAARSGLDNIQDHVRAALDTEVESARVRFQEMEHDFQLRIAGVQAAAEREVASILDGARARADRHVLPLDPFVEAGRD